MPEAREDFQLQIMQHETTRQLGARLNIFCRYRYRRVEHGNPETFDYRDARSIILRIIDASNTDVHVVRAPLWFLLLLAIHMQSIRC